MSFLQVCSWLVLVGSTCPGSASLLLMVEGTCLKISWTNPFSRWCSFPPKTFILLRITCFISRGFIDIASPLVLSFLLESLYPLLIQLSILRAGQYFPTLPSQHCKRISPRATLTCYTNTEETGPLLPLTPIPTNISSHPYQQFFSFFSKVAPFFSSWLNWKKSKICTNIVSCQF